jgi:hypothetical protein
MQPCRSSAAAAVVAAAAAAAAIAVTAEQNDEDQDDPDPIAAKTVIISAHDLLLLPLRAGYLNFNSLLSHAVDKDHTLLCTAAPAAV